MDWICESPSINEIIHPEEHRAILAIQKSNFYSLVTHRCGDIISSINQIPKMILTGYPITEYSAPRIYRCYQKALIRLGCRENYPLFMDFSYELSGKAYGTDENGYFILISSQCGEVLTDDELTAFLGGEIGRILAGHPQQHAMLDNLQVITNRIPFGGEIVRNKTLGLFIKWIIASGYTVDRAALIACENIDSFISLRKKQMGYADAGTKAILSQKPDTIPKEPGMYYALMAKDMPLINGVGRIQELHRWIQTRRFAQNFMPLLYKLCLRSTEITIPHNEELLERHRKAADNDTSELALLGEQYLFGKCGLQLCTKTGESMLRQASFQGNARAMFIEGGCMEMGLVDGRKRHQEAQALYRAAASRGSGKIKQKTVSENSRLKMPPTVILAAKESLKSTPLRYWLSLSGQEPDKETLRNALNMFWISRDEAVFAHEFTKTTAGIIGIVLTSGGIYGSLTPGGIPFFVSWKQYFDDELIQMERNGYDCLFIGEKPIYRCHALINGTIAELLIRIKNIKKENG